MALEIKQTLKLSQQLIMTPQLQQAIKLLQLSRIELLDLIHQEMKENPVLEEIQENPVEKTDQETQITEEIGSPNGEGNLAKDDSPDADFDWRDYLYQDAKTPWDPLSSSRTSGGEDDETNRFIERSPAKKKGLQDHLFEQLALSALDMETKQLGELIIGNLDNNGYLKASVEEMAFLVTTKPDKVEKALKEIQKFDPPGVAARDLKECLMLQLPLLKNHQEDLDLIEKILDLHINNLGRKL